MVAADKHGLRLTDRFQVQLMLRFLLVVSLLAAVIFGLVYQTIYRQQLDRTELLLRQQADSCLAQLENRIETVESDALSILSNSTIKDYLTYPYRKDSLKARDAVYNFQPVVRWVLTINSQYRRIHFLTANETTAGGPFVSALGDFLEVPWVRAAMESPSHDHWIGLHTPESFGHEAAPAQDVVSYVLYSRSGRHLVSMDTSAAWMFQGLPLVADRGTGRILHSDARPEAVNTTLPGTTEALRRVELMGEPCYVCAAPCDALDVLLLTCEPAANVRRQIDAQMRAFALWLLLFVAAAVVLLYVFSRSALRRMSRISKNVSQIARGSYDVAYEARKRDEIDALGTDIVDMARQMNQMVNQRLNQQMLLRETEFRALEQQINPHFIFNMIQTMQMIAEMNDQTDLADMMAKFGRMVRYNLYATMNVPLSQELGNVRDYLELQKALCNDELDVRIEMNGVPEALEVPRLLLQPLVENAITHGHTAGKVLHVRILGERAEDGVRMRIFNDGKPLTPEREAALEAVLEGVRMNPGRVDGGNARENLALINVQKRLLIRFGPACRLSIRNADGGVIVAFDIPGTEDLP